MPYALIDGQNVCQVSEEKFPVAEPLAWVRCAASVTPLHSYVDGKFTLGPHEAAVRAGKIAVLQNLLRESDWSMFPDAGLDDQRRAAWIDYRNQIRQAISNPDDSIIPERPE